MKRYHSDWQANVSYRQVGVNTYTLIIRITDGMNVPVINMDDIVVRDGEILLKSDLEEINTDGY